MRLGCHVHEAPVLSSIDLPRNAGIDGVVPSGGTACVNVTREVA